MRPNKYAIFTATFIIFFNFLCAQPHITGNVEIEMESGLFSCSFTISNIPNMEDYRILLNKGMNIKYFKDGKGEILNYSGYYNGKVQGEAIEYYFTSPDDERMELPTSFYLQYNGAFPVYTDDLNSFDFKGLIAFNGQTVRATEQTKWYPVLYDVANDRLLHDYTYDLTISVKDGTTIFLNGSAPQKKSVSHFSSTKPYPLLLFAGNYDFVSNSGDYILNSNISQGTAVKIFENIAAIKNVLSSKLELEFTDNIYLINHDPVNKRKEGSSWGFNTYPTFAFTGLDFETLINEEGKFPANIYKYFGHEFGHNYFGNNVLSGNLSWFWLESFAEYLSYNVAEEISGKAYLNQVLIDQTKQLENKKFTPLHRVKNKDEIGEAYRYVLGPLLLKCFEDTFGAAKMNGVIQSLLEYAKDQTLTLAHWQKAAVANGISEKEFKKFEKKFVRSRHFKKNIVKEITRNHS